MTEENLLSELRSRYGYMFPKTARLDFYRGWIEPISTMCSEIDDVLGPNRRNFHFDQIKEKFGQARIFFALTGRQDVVIDCRAEGEVSRLTLNQDHVNVDLAEKVRAIVKAVEDATGTRCMLCGGRSKISSCGFLLVCLCAEHSRAAVMRDPWSAALVPWPTA